LVARIAAPRVTGSGAVTGLDVNPNMLAVARQVTATVRPAIEWIHASALQTGLPGAAFDVGFCQQGLQFFPDRRAALRELHRVIAPGGRVAISVWCDACSPGYAPFWTTFARRIPDIGEAVGFLRAIFSLDDADELRHLLGEAGFRDVRVERRTGTVRCASASAWARAFLGGAPIPGIATQPPDVLDRIARDVTDALREYIDGDGRLAFPMDANVALAYRR
jgi:ubiquinone/menaquinone biosynthesis C-methylase UbiE